MTRAIVVFFGIYLLVSCSERMVCPAYQSAFIYDKDELRKKFSYFKDDTIPKLQYTASKNKYLVADHMPYRTKIRTMQTVKMKPVFVNVPDSLSGKGDKDSVSMADLDRAARSVIDSTFIQDVPKKDTVAAPLDSIYVITKDKELRLLKYNMPDSLEYDSITQRYIKQKPEYYVTEVRYNLEQDHYMWYLRHSLVLPDVRLAKMQQGSEKEEAGKKSGKKKGLKGFFKNLFRKKQKEEVDSASLKPPPQEEFDFIDEADTVSKAEIPLPGQEDAKSKKGLFGPKKDRPKKERKKKEKKPKKEEVNPAEKKKEDEDDGF